MIEQILSYFIFSEVEIIALSVFFLFFLIQLFFYFNYYKKPYSYAKKIDGDSYESSQPKPKVSVIISSENEAVELAKNLPAILSQDYPDFEVIVVNNGSTDESDELLLSLKLNNPHLYHTYLPSSPDKRFGSKKLAYTIGIKAAKGDILLFTEPHSKPVSHKWISSMVDEISDEKEVVLGYSYYKKTKQFFNRIARFDNLLFSMQYLSMAIKKKPFTGTYRNLAFKKHLFFENKGFAAHLALENGEDVFINQIVNAENTVVALSQDSFIETSIDRFSLWKQIKKSYSVAKAHFNSSVPALFGFEAFSRYVFYALMICLITYAALFQNWAMLGIAVFFFLFRLIVQLIIMNKSAKYFHSGIFHFSLLLMDVFQPIYNLKFRTRQKRGIR